MAKIIGMAGYRRGRVRRSMRPARSAATPSHSAAGEARTPAAQMIVPAGSAFARRTPRRRRAFRHRTGRVRRWTPSFSSALLRIGRQIPAEARAARAVAGFDQDDARLARVDVAELAGSVSRVSSAMVPASSTPVGPATDDDEASSAPARSAGIALAVRPCSKAEQDAPADRRGVLQRLQAGRERLPFVMAEIGVPRAGGEHQRVVGDDRAIIQPARASPRDRSRQRSPSSVVTSARSRRRCRIGRAISEVASDVVAT